MIRERRNRKRKIVICFIVISLLFFPFYAEGCSECPENQIEWFRTYSGSLKSSASSIIRVSDGGFIVAGNDFVDEENDDVLLLKTDSKGEMIWNKTFGGIGSDKARVVIQTNDGGLALAGYTSSYGSGDSDVYLIKTDS